jgi:signal transduction histidine kinase
VSVAVSRSDGGATRLVVGDDGRGFDAGARERRGAQGHLGLTLLEGIVTQAGGTLEVRSAPGKGTTVELDLPAR